MGVDSISHAKNDAAALAAAAVGASAAAMQSSQEPVNISSGEIEKTQETLASRRQEAMVQKAPAVVSEANHLAVGPSPQQPPMTAGVATNGTLGASLAPSAIQTNAEVMPPQQTPARTMRPTSAADPLVTHGSQGGLFHAPNAGMPAPSQVSEPVLAVAPAPVPAQDQHPPGTSAAKPPGPLGPGAPNSELAPSAASETHSHDAAWEQVFGKRVAMPSMSAAAPAEPVPGAEPVGPLPACEPTTAAAPPPAVPPSPSNPVAPALPSVPSIPPSPQGGLPAGPADGSADVASLRPQPQDIQATSNPFGARPQPQAIQASSNPFGARPQPKPIQANSNPFGRPQPKPIQAASNPFGAMR